MLFVPTSLGDSKLGTKLKDRTPEEELIENLFQSSDCTDWPPTPPVRIEKVTVLESSAATTVSIVVPAA